MTDRQLLEAAANAASLNVFWHEDLQRMVYFVGSASSKPAVWNPLLDDGDAFRLAVRLRMSLRKETLPHAVYMIAVTDTHSARETLADVRLEVQPDQLAATRRAIVRAAAAIGGAE